MTDTRTPEALEKRRIQEQLRHDLNKYVQEHDVDFEQAPMWKDYLAASEAYNDATTREQRDAVMPSEIKIAHQESIAREAERIAKEKSRSSLPW